ncbi:hypothetical protein ACFWBB_30930 [Streptomyces sp. NPDC060000]|uniref:hypothetical protein n=1 Tax=Streptomyces sp. NPDC060000 TaxID=3347031 RepID=UPI0036B2E65C
MSAPTVTRADIQQLLASTGEDPVLYLKAGPDNEGGPLEVDVWVSAYVSHARVLVHRHEVVDAIGDAPDDDDVDEYLSELEQTVEDVAAALA